MEDIENFVTDTSVLTEVKIYNITECLKKNAVNDPERAHQLQIKVYEKFIRDVSENGYELYPELSMITIAKKILQLKRLTFPRGY